MSCWNRRTKIKSIKSYLILDIHISGITISIFNLNVVDQEFNPNRTIVQLYQVTFWQDDVNVSYILDQHDLSWVFKMLDHWKSIEGHIEFRVTSLLIEWISCYYFFKFLLKRILSVNPATFYWNAQILFLSSLTQIEEIYLLLFETRISSNLNCKGIIRNSVTYIPPFLSSL
jgi:hypothetical protein